MRARGHALAHPACPPPAHCAAGAAPCELTRPSLLASLAATPTHTLPAHADTFIQKTKKLYVDTRTQRNLARLNEDLADVHAIMTRSLQEVLGQGQKLDGMAAMSASLSAESKAYANRAADLRRQALIRKYMPIGVVVAVVLLVLWLRSFWT